MFLKKISKIEKHVTFEASDFSKVLRKNENRKLDFLLFLIIFYFLQNILINC